MKKLIMWVLFSAGSAAFAQKYEFGFKAGTSLSNFTGTGSWQDVKSRTLVGYHFGGLVSFFVGSSFAIQPEVLFSSQGAKFESAGKTTDQNIYYINVPVMLKYRTKPGFYIEAGPQIGFKTGESSTTIDSLARNTDLSLAGGLGFHSRIGLGIGVRYIAGLSTVGDFEPSNGINPDFKNAVLQFSLFYTFFKARK